MQGERTCYAVESYRASLLPSSVSNGYYSVDLTQYLLQGYYSNACDALLDPDALPKAHILELG